jgi:hypothetical protein
MLLSDFRNMLPISDYEQRTDSWEQWSSRAKWMTWVFPLLVLFIFFSLYLCLFQTLCFPEAPGIQDTTNKQINSVQFPQ